MDWRMNNSCVYCGDYADTRDHVPSKCFLDEPYPDNLKVVPCCRKCNNKFSKDEEYVSCFIDCMKEKISIPLEIKRLKTHKTLVHSTKLTKEICSQIIPFADCIVYDYDKVRFDKVMYKLAYGHLAYENDSLNYDSTYKVTYRLLDNLSRDSLGKFEKPYQGDLLPEVGSRSLSKIGGFRIMEGPMGFVSFSDWIIIQNGRYRYCVSPDSKRVKFVIAEYLAVEVLI